MQINQPDIERLNELFYLDREAGVLRWKIKPNHLATNVTVGEVAGSGHGRYSRVCFDGVRYLTHRLIWSIYHQRITDLYIDHINGNTHDNRICNLREATHGQNKINSRKGKGSNFSSKFKGVCWRKNERKWSSVIGCDNKKIHLGYFDTEEAAHEAYVSAAIEYFGEFARAA